MPRTFSQGKATARRNGRTAFAGIALIGLRGAGKSTSAIARRKRSAGVLLS